MDRAVPVFRLPVDPVARAAVDVTAAQLEAGYTPAEVRSFTKRAFEENSAAGIGTKQRIGSVEENKFLVLVPRCLKKEARAGLLNRLNGGAQHKVFTVAGGEEARNLIRQYRPTSILAIACERDLMSGIKDVAEKIPVFAVPNKRPEGPCKNTEYSLHELEDALKVLKVKEKAA